MSNPRLSLAVTSGDIVLPDDGQIALIRPRADLSMDGLPLDRLHVVQGFLPDYEAFKARGLSVDVTLTGRYVACVVHVPRAKAEARALIAAACAATDGLVIVDGQKTDGIDSLLRDLRKRGDVGLVFSKAHGKLIALQGGDFSDWADRGAQTVADGFVTRLGVFSADGPDKGSAALVAALPPLKGAVADLGAGWGYLSRAILNSPSVNSLHLVEAEHAALECARENIHDPRAAFHWADATRWTPPVKLDAVVTNPPFHTARAADPALGRAFLASAAGMLAPAGQLWLVANRHLPYEKALTGLFREVEEMAGDRSFKILRAMRPLGQMKGTR